MADSYDNDEFRGGQALSVRRLRVTADSNQIEFAGGAIINWNPTGARTLTLPDSDIDMADIGDLALPATTTTLGGVIVGTAGRLGVDGSGHISVALATTTTTGVVIVPTAGRLAVDGAGNISVDTTKVPALNLNNTFTKAQYLAASSPTYSGTISLDPTLSNVFRVTSIHATSATCTLNLATVPVAGNVIWAVLSANNNADVFTFGANFLSTGTVTPTSGKFIAVGFISDGTNAVEFSRSAAAM